MKILIAALIAGVSLLWAAGLWIGDDFIRYASSISPTGHVLDSPSLPWLIRQEVLYWSGFLAIALMSLSMFLSTRRPWMNRILGGAGAVYQAHKWAGIWGGVFALTHWVTKEVVGDVLKSLFGRAGRFPKNDTGVWFSFMHDIAEEAGEWAFYIVLILIAIALFQKIPATIRRTVHRIMPVLYLMLAFHAVILSQPSHWMAPMGALVALLLCAGTYGAVHSLRHPLRLGSMTRA